MQCKEELNIYSFSRVQPFVITYLCLIVVAMTLKRQLLSDGKHCVRLSVEIIGLYLTKKILSMMYVNLSK